MHESHDYLDQLPQRIQSKMKRRNADCCRIRNKSSCKKCEYIKQLLNELRYKWINNVLACQLIKSRFSLQMLLGEKYRRRVLSGGSPVRHADPVLRGSGARGLCGTVVPRVVQLLGALARFQVSGVFRVQGRGSAGAKEVPTGGYLRRSGSGEDVPASRFFCLNFFSIFRDVFD